MKNIVTSTFVTAVLVMSGYAFVQGATALFALAAVNSAAAAVAAKSAESSDYHHAGHQYTCLAHQHDGANKRPGRTIPLQTW